MRWERGTCLWFGWFGGSGVGVCGVCVVCVSSLCSVYHNTATQAGTRADTQQHTLRAQFRLIKIRH